MVKLIRGINDLKTKCPNIVNEWDYENNHSKPEDYTIGSVKKVSWVCSKGHRWETSIKNRTMNKSGCPYCSGSKVLVGINDLQTINPTLAKQWHPSKNGTLTPKDVKAGSSKKVWWIGECGHIWDDTVYNRNNGYNCPICVGKRVLVGYNDLESIYPSIASEWHPTLNGDLRPSNITYGSGHVAFWLCPNGHTYAARVINRTQGDNCPICSGHTVLKGYNDLATLNPQLANEWDYELNDLTPYEVTENSSKRVNWICSVCDHHWISTISNRNKGSGCPACYKQTSFSEQAILYYLEISNVYAINRYTEQGFELDIFIPNFNIAIEYDGVKYHNQSKKESSDLLKNKKCMEFGIKLFRIREHGLRPLEHCVNIFRRSDSLYSLTKAIEELFALLDIDANIDVSRDEIKIQEKYKTAHYNNSLAVMYPEVAKEWHPIKNGTLKPENVSTGVNTKVWWLGKCGHEWQATIASRCKGAQCRICADKRNGERSSKPDTGKSFGDIYPKLIEEWADTNEHSPFEYKPGSGKKVKWICSVCGNIWEARIVDRAKGHGCKKCANANMVKKKSF